MLPNTLQCLNIREGPPSEGRRQLMYCLGTSMYSDLSHCLHAFVYLTLYRKFPLLLKRKIKPMLVTASLDFFLAFPTRIISGYRDARMRSKRCQMCLCGVCMGFSESLTQGSTSLRWACGVCTWPCVTWYPHAYASVSHKRISSEVLALQSAEQLQTLRVTVTVTVTDCLSKHELQKSLHPSPVSRLLRSVACPSVIITG